MKPPSRWILSLSGLLALAVPTAAWACDYSDNQSVYDVLGLAGLPSERTDVSLPRNVAFVFFSREPGARPQLTAANVPVELELLGIEPERAHFGLQTARELLEPDVVYDYGLTGPFTVADYIDETAPEPARVVKASMTAWDGGGSCGGSSCGEVVSVAVQLIPGADEHTETSALTYAMYLGESAQAAFTTTQVERFLVLDDLTELVFRSGYEWTERDMFVSVSTLDHAGNESSRTEPIQIHSSPSGCRIALGSDLSSFVWAMAAIIWHAIRRRRQRSDNDNVRERQPSSGGIGRGSVRHFEDTPYVVRLRAEWVLCPVLVAQ
jgi:hypothetical protein